MKLAVTHSLEYSINEKENGYIVKELGDMNVHDVVIPSEYDGLPVTGIDNYAFYKSNHIKSIYIPESVKDIGSCSFLGCSELGSITVNPDNDYFKSEYDCLLFKDGKTLIFGSMSSVIPDSVTEISYYAFSHCKNLKRINVPDSVTLINGFAFLDCSSLTEITLPVSLNTIGIFSFKNCTSLKTINYQGAKAQWEAINKPTWWDSETGNYIVKCTDGNLKK